MRKESKILSIADEWNLEETEFAKVIYKDRLHTQLKSNADYIAMNMFLNLKNGA